MIREAISADRLEYQVASGLAEVGNGALRDLELEAPRVAFLVDGDGGGEAHAKRLARSGIDPAMVIHVGGRKSGATIEDLLRDDVYLGGVNKVLGELGATKVMPRTALARGTSRSESVKKWCSRKGVPVPGKPAVAVAILDLGEENLLTSQGTKQLATVHEQILAALGISAE